MGHPGLARGAYELQIDTVAVVPPRPTSTTRVKRRAPGSAGTAAGPGVVMCSIILPREERREGLGPNQRVGDDARVPDSPGCRSTGITSSRISVGVGTAAGGRRISERGTRDVSARTERGRNGAILWCCVCWRCVLAELATPSCERHRGEEDSLIRQTRQRDASCGYWTAARSRFDAWLYSP